MARPISIGILTRSTFRSQRFIAEGLADLLRRMGVEVTVYTDGIAWLKTLHRRGGGLRDALRARAAERGIEGLGRHDVLVVSDSVQAFSDEVDITPLRRHSKPVVQYAVFYAGGAKHWVERLPLHVFDKYDAYLVGSDIHGMAPVGSKPIYQVGINLLPSQPFLRDRDAFVALVDFPREGYEEQREVQVRALRTLGIETVCLEGDYTFEQIERIYHRIALAFVSFPEAFGVPIVQLQHYGAYIACPQASWVMRHALLPSGAVFFDVKEPAFSENFCFYDSESELVERIAQLRQHHDPMSVRECLQRVQPSYHEGNAHALWKFIMSFAR